MWGFFRNFLKKEETAKVANLAEFVEEKSKATLNEFESKLKAQDEKIDETIKKTRDDLKKLKDAELLNKGISTKEKQIMQGNRDSYIKFVNILIEKLKNQDNLEQHNIILEEFTKSTAKSYYVLQHFFSYEAREIALDIKKLDSLIKELKEIKKHTAEISALKQDIAELGRIKELKQGKQDKLKKLNECKKENEKKIKEFDDRAKALKESEGFREYLRIQTEKSDLKKELEALKSGLSHNFSIIEKALKKMQKIVLDYRTVENYLASPTAAVINDKELKILEIVEKTKKAVSSNKLELKDKKSEKTAEVLELLNRDYFKDYIKRHNELAEKISMLNQKTENNETVKQIEESIEQMKVEENKLNIISREIKELENKDFDTEKIKHEILDKIKDVFKVRVELEN